MTPLLERQLAAGSAGAELTPPPPPEVRDNVLMAPPAARSRGRPGGGNGAREAAAAEGAFVCRTCSRRFPSFQALGGHRTGHTRIQARHAMPPRQQKPAARAAHECAVCGLEFAMGQALGGHMRRHKLPQGEAPARAEVEVEVEVGVEAEKRGEETKALDSSCALPLEEHRGGDRAEGCSSGSGSGSEPRLLNLLV